MTEPLIHREIEQHSPEWYAIKAGKWSASSAAIIMGGLDTSGLASLIQDIAWERVFGPTAGGFKSSAMERGNELEPEARAWFCQERSVEIEQVGFVLHATLPNVGWSPDGLYAGNARRAIEAKCPLHKAWMSCKKQGKVPAEYRWQTRWAMWVGQLDGLEFLAYHPQAGGLVIDCEVTDDERAQMEERVALLEPKVQQWIEVIGNSRNTYQPPRAEDFDINDPGVRF
ncbi:lambda-exonuclease family protein [Lysobacter enzymogenes]|uniref:lambda-exonuclease family protein n=1 Tax=Lysobacter enzymogenes TaxID=69 RepID=UPI0038504618